MSLDPHTLSGAYSLDALSHEEAGDFSRHLQDCPACRDEVRELQETAATLGAAEATPAPPALRARVLAAADRTPQLRPKVTQIDTARSRRRLTRVLGAAAAVVIVAAVAFGVHQSAGPEQPAVTAQVAQVFHAPDAQRKTLHTPRGPVSVATSEHLGRMAVDTHRLQALPGPKVYQLWTLHAGTATSAGIVSNRDGGKVMAIPKAGTEVAITVEPAGGSSKPTTKPIVNVDPAKV